MLVCCGAGMSRSPVFVAAFFHEEGMELDAAFELIRERRPIIRPHPRLVRSLESHYGFTSEDE
jgi:protein-tyrosine phosphatase